MMRDFAFAVQIHFLPFYITYQPSCAVRTNKVNPTLLDLPIC